MTDQQKVTAYIGKHARWSEQLTQLRTIFDRTELKEEVKWGSPTYTLDGKLVAGMAAFKNHYAIWFHQGVFLNDPAGVLHNAQEGKTKASEKVSPNVKRSHLSCLWSPALPSCLPTTRY